MKTNICLVSKRGCPFKPLAPYPCRFESLQELWNISYEEASLRNVDDSTRVPRVPEIIHGWEPEVFSHQYIWKVPILQCWCDVISDHNIVSETTTYKVTVFIIFVLIGISKCLCAIKTNLESIPFFFTNSIPILSLKLTFIYRKKTWISKKSYRR